MNLFAKMIKHRWLLRALLDGHCPSPTWGHIDPVTKICNLHCPFCPTGTGTLQMEKRLLKLDEFKVILSKMPSEFKELHLYNWGESLLNPAFPDMVLLAKQRGMDTYVDTNLSIPLAIDFIARIIQNGLDELTVSLDGATQASYERYRRGGDVERVFTNIRAFVDVKRKLGSKTPHITWKFLVNRFTEPEIPLAWKKAEELGVTLNRLPMGIPDNLRAEWAASDAYPLPPPGAISYPRAICTHLFQSITVNSDGSVVPCCNVTDKKYSWGNLLTDEFESIWNGDNFRLARNKFVPIMFKPRKVQFPNPCVGCMQYATLGQAIPRRINDLWR